MFDQEGEQVAIIEYAEAIDNAPILSLEWVSSHPRGQMWLHGRSGHLYEFFVDREWNCELVQDFEGQGEQGRGIAHDDENMWIARFNAQDPTFYVIDDGVQEVTWLSYDPSEFEVEGEGQQEVTVTVDCHGLFEGDYEADMTFTTNDPDDEAVVVSVAIFVEGAPDISVTWSAALGYNADNPDESLVDWNLAFQDLFTGVSYDVTVMVTNTGSAPLEVVDIYCDNNRFTADPVELVLEHDESADIILTFQTDADDPGEFTEMMIFESNDPDNAECEVALHAMAMRPPEVRIEPVAIEDELFVGAVEEYLITVFNDGESPLRVTVTHEIVGEPERDADNRYRGARQLRRALIQPTEVGSPTRNQSLFR